ncbi:MAG: LacI family DNA-binding transcriptional regulator [Lachnospiraceae bacterium]|nr:LacI family DNA-binding transcriptional regulator [Lachnospiraceae bacterium]
MVSMKDIARRCNVSVATVSKALNDQTDIGEQTKDLIKKAAKEMGYFPNAQARALRTNRSYNIGVLFVDEGRSGLTHDYFSKVLDSFKMEVEEHGYDLTFINCSKKNRTRYSYLEHSRYRGFDGVVIACIDFNDPEVLDLVNSDIPVVTIDYMFNNRSSVVSNNYAGMQALVDYIVGLGHTKIAYICGDNTAVTQKRLAAFYQVLEEHNISIPEDYVIHDSYRNIKGAEEKTKLLLKRKDRPTCILYSDDYSAIGGLNAIKAAGLEIPTDISVAGYDGVTAASLVEPMITTIRQDTVKIGQTAARKLINHIERPKTTLEEQITVDGFLEKGKTVSKLN